MVKGISRQVIVVRSPDPKLFEQAIFILREDALGKGGMSDPGPFCARPSRRRAVIFPPANGGRSAWAAWSGRRAAPWRRVWRGC